MHRHHSTMHAREKLYEADQPTMDCITCKVRHSRDIQGDRYKVLVTSSTLHDAWLEPSVPNMFHMDLISICGGTMRLGRMDWTKSYSLQSKAVDVVVAIGLNDVRKIEPKDFKKEMITWKFAIEAHEMANGVQNTIAFAKMPHAPCMAWLPGDGPFPTGNYRNFLHKVDAFNKAIEELNASSGHCQRAISFENEGKRTTKGGKPQHVWRSWRENKAENMLHLSDYHRAKMFNRIVKYLDMNTVRCEEDQNV